MGKKKMIASISLYDVRNTTWKAAYVSQFLKDPDETGEYDQMVRIWLRAWSELYTDQYYLFQVIVKPDTSLQR